MKSFEVPTGYRSNLISAIKQKRKEQDKLKKDFSPTLLDFGHLKIYLARHFGFCYGVENAINIAYKTIEENQGKRIFLLSEMIHNPQVNADLTKRGVQFLQDTSGNELIPLDTLNADDVVIIPAFGTTLELEEKIIQKGIDIQKYNTTCPFVEKVWNRSEQIAKKGYSIIIHGKPKHEETRATFSHAAANTPSIVVNDMEEAKVLGAFILGKIDLASFELQFKGRYSRHFNPTKDLDKIGVVNQTTQLSAVIGLLETSADLAIVMGGKNSSNSSHLVELCEQKLPTYFIDDASKVISKDQIQKTDWKNKESVIVSDYLPKKENISILMTSGASCPDAVVEAVIHKITSYYGVEDMLKEMEAIWSN